MFQFPTFRFSFYLTLTCCLTQVLSACGGDSSSEEEGAESNQSTKTEKRISKIEISQFGKITQLLMGYENDVISIEFQPYQKNVEARIELNSRKQIREIISGSSRIQYLYDENGREIGIFSDNGQQQIMFDYDGDNISHQYTISGNDTVVKFRYTYSNGLPSEVEIIGAYPYYRKYDLHYSDVDNSLSGFNELILPAESVSLLGIPAMYGKKYLLRAVRTDAEAATQAPLQEKYTPSFQELVFEVSKSGKQEALNLISDGSRQWSAVIYWQ
jgi:hypothetical protein